MLFILLLDLWCKIIQENDLSMSKIFIKILSCILKRPVIIQSSVSGNLIVIATIILRFVLL